jgi:NHL repeat
MLRAGAYGNVPNDDKQPPYDPAAPVSQQFRNPVHCIKIANDGLVYVCDGLVYVCDRTNNRIQVFRKDGTFVKEWDLREKHARQPARDTGSR